MHKDYQRQGIAAAICKELENAVKVEKAVTHASITAKPFFLSQGYQVKKKQQVMRGGVLLVNYVMEKHLHNNSSDKPPVTVERFLTEE